MRTLTHRDDRRRQPFFGEIGGLVADQLLEIPTRRALAHEIDHVREDLAGTRPDQMQALTVRLAQVKQQERILAAGKQQHRALRPGHRVFNQL